MVITYNNCKYELNDIISKEKLKESREYYALAALHYSFPDMFCGLRKKESPDLQDRENSICVEVTWGGSEDEQQALGERIKYSNTNSDEEKQKSLEIMRDHGGDIIKSKMGLITDYKLGDSDSVKRSIETSYTKKNRKIKKYRTYFKQVGLAILVDVPISVLRDIDIDNWLTRINEDNYDFVILIHWNGIYLYDFQTKKHTARMIDKTTITNLKTLGRLTAEEKISEDDYSWHKVICE